jgi:hypothetical protein
MDISPVIIAPLDWGMGHFTRSAMKVRECLAVGHKVYVAVEERGEKYFRSVFGDRIEYLYLPGYGVTYSRWGVVWGIMWSLPHMWRAYKAERKLAEKWAEEINPSRMFSDHRYGFWVKRRFTVFMTHQLYLPVPWYLGFLNKIHHYLIKEFTFISVYDREEEPRYAGKLSREAWSGRYPIITYSGLASQFHLSFFEGEEDIPMYDILILLSGPEPQRTILENKLIKVFNPEKDFKVGIVRGTDKPLEIKAEFDSYDLPQEAFLGQLLRQCSLVICRSGYSTIMDLLGMGKTPIFIPTPGQWEQEYLAKHMKKHFNAPWIPERRVRIIRFVATNFLRFRYNNMITGLSK